ncbi:hypothetical protein DPEC_G00073710 [Dallia pectoralis]|uniref:Uncharacterized protein n=1 Tax=Dallia pectoralis TaxID=75939 RepID=A0ACC2H3P7_DALPE|nr:hypothetical protein DPEC_G00073710 [Dallia pectoralis]
MIADIPNDHLIPYSPNFQTVPILYSLGTAIPDPNTSQQGGILLNPSGGHRASGNKAVIEQPADRGVPWIQWSALRDMAGETTSGKNNHVNLHQPLLEPFTDHWLTMT